MIRFCVYWFLLSMCITLIVIDKVGAEPAVPKFSEMSGPPQMVENEDGSWSVVLPFGDVMFKYRLSGDGKAKPMPQCNVVTPIGSELQIIQARPNGMVLFTQGFPYEFLTKHNNEWLPMVRPTFTPSR